MMDFWKQSIFSMITVTFGCGILTQILPDSKRKALLQLVFGTVLAIVILRPLTRIHLEEIFSVPLPDPGAADAWLQSGKKTAEEARSQYITSACEAYILDRAKALGIPLQVQIFLNEQWIPESVEIKGAFDLAAQSELQSILTMDLGIPKENQTWIWNQEASGSSLP